MDQLSQMRKTVQHGDLYRLISPRDGSERSATLPVSPDRRQARLLDGVWPRPLRDDFQAAGLVLEADA